MKKIFVILFFIFFITLFFTYNCQAGIKIWPGKLYITINEWDEKIEYISHPIQITNPYNYGVNVTTKKEIPNNESIESGYSMIPDISWIEITPDEHYIPPKSSREFNAFIKVPEDIKNEYFNEKWDARVVFTSDILLGAGGGMQFQIELAVKLLIKTPTGEAAGIQSILILLFFIVLIITMCVLSIYIGKKKKNASLFYFKKKK